MSEVTYDRLRVADPARWRQAAVAWRSLAGAAGRRAAEFAPVTDRLRTGWSGAAAQAADARLAALHRAVVLVRLCWWEADQVLCEFAAGLSRAKVMLAAAVGGVERAGLVIDPAGLVSGGASLSPAERQRAVGRSGIALGAALSIAASADAVAAGRLAELRSVATILATGQAAAGGSLAEAPAGWAPLAAGAASVVTAAGLAGLVTPPCGAAPAEVSRWWAGLSPTQQRWLVAVEPAVVGPLDGVPARFRDLANRLCLEDRRAQLVRRLGTAHGAELRRLRRLQAGLDTLAGRLADATAPRAYLLGLALSDEGRAVVALGDPDRADNVLTHVPGMTAGLATFDGELTHAARVADRARELAPAESTSAVVWLDYDAPDFLGEAAGAGRAEAGATTLHRFQDGLRASHTGPPAQQTVLGHSYGSLVVGVAAARGGLAADSVVFVGSPGVGVDSAAALHTPPGQVWSSTSASDIIQYAAVAPGSLLPDLAVATWLPPVGLLAAFGRPEDALWFGHNPSDPGFGARVFTSQPDAGHLGYWDPGRPALDNLARITLGGAQQAAVR